jgi:hypothetical protein
MPSASQNQTKDDVITGQIIHGFPKSMIKRTIYERASCVAVSVVVTPSLVKKLR